VTVRETAGLSAKGQPTDVDAVFDEDNIVTRLLGHGDPPVEGACRAC
jgi:hypothetical protein